MGVWVAGWVAGEMENIAIFHLEVEVGAWQYSITGWEWEDIPEIKTLIANIVTAPYKTNT